MHRLLLLVVLAVTACSQATATRVDNRTFRIEGPSIAGGSDVPNRRLAERACPKGFRILDESRHKEDLDGVTTTWTIRCL